MWNSFYYNNDDTRKVINRYSIIKKIFLVIIDLFFKSIVDINKKDNN